MIDIGYYLASMQIVPKSHSQATIAQSGNETKCILPAVVGVFGTSVDRESKVIAVHDDLILWPLGPQVKVEKMVTHDLNP